MVGTQVDRRSKFGIRCYACTIAAGSYYGSTMAATDRERSQGSSRNGITRRRRRPLVYLIQQMAFTESKAYCTSAPWMYRALVFLHIEIEDSFFQESNTYFQNQDLVQ